MRVITSQLLLLALGLASVVSGKALYDPVKSYVTVLNQKNWDGQVAKNRAKGITIVHFYKDTGRSRTFHKHPIDSVSKNIAG